MNHSNSGLAHGTNGSPQLTTENSEAERIAHNNEADIAEQWTLKEELKRNNVKFNPADVLFVTRDKTGQIVWLETGNSMAGLKHILDGNGKTPGHAADFERAFGVKRDDLPAYLKTVIANGKIVSDNIVKVGARDGYERVYYYEGKHVVVTAIGMNGFIVSAYPKRIKEEPNADN